MAGVKKLLKQAQKMQEQMEALQGELEGKILKVSAGGGAVEVSINGQGTVTGIKLDPDFLREEAALVEETLLQAVQEAQAKAKEESDAAMQQLSGGMPFPGMM